MWTGSTEELSDATDDANTNYGPGQVTNTTNIKLAADISSEGGNLLLLECLGLFVVFALCKGSNVFHPVTTGCMYANNYLSGVRFR